MKTMLQTWWSAAKTQMAARTTVNNPAEEAYLAQAVDLGDLEQRMRQLERQSSEGAFVRLRLMAYGRP